MAVLYNGAISDGRRGRGWMDGGDYNYTNLVWKSLSQ